MKNENVAETDIKLKLFDERNLNGVLVLERKFGE